MFCQCIFPSELYDIVASHDCQEIIILTLKIVVILLCVPIFHCGFDLHFPTE